MSELDELKAAISEDRRRHCRHFNGLANECCKIGIAYAPLLDASAGPHRYPCLGESAILGNAATVCEKREFLSKDEADEIAEKAVARLVQRGEDIKAGLCPICRQPMEKQQVGRCIYAHPCGHRLGLGTLPTVKLKKGDRLVQTDRSPNKMPDGSPRKGVYLGPAKSAVTRDSISVLCDGEERPASWHRDFWKKDGGAL